MIQIQDRITDDSHKAIAIEETLDEKSAETADGFRRFKDFQEIGFVKNSDTRDYHMDMTEFSKYLELNNCLYMFKLLFGFEKQNNL